MRACDGCRKMGVGVEAVRLSVLEYGEPDRAVDNLAEYDLCETCRQVAREGRLRFRITAK